jgi:SAM-dependent methyltransferase
MQAYSSGFARVYNVRWDAFARHVAPLILQFYSATSIGQTNKLVLDLCCGTGQLATHFLENGYQVVGLDLSAPMLRYAQENAGAYVQAGQARFVQGDASDFSFDERFGLVVSTFDSLNHLEDERALARCFRCVLAVCEGFFIFDLNTRAGLRRWNHVQVDDGEEILIVNRGIYDGQGDRAWVKITGFERTADGLYERFEQTAFNTAFDMARVQSMLLEAGWREAYCARAEDLQSPVTAPEEEARVFFVASK